MRSDTSKM